MDTVNSNVDFINHLVRSQSLFEAFCLKMCYLLEVKINDNIIEELPTVKALQVLHCNCYSSFQWWRRKLNQPEQRWKGWGKI